MSMSRRKHLTRGSTVSTSILPRLATEFRQRLAELDLERARVAATLLALDGATRPQTEARRRPAPLDERIKRALRKDPGTRASMLAELEGLSIDAVRAQLRIMEQHQVVARDGLGWSLRTD